MINKQNKNVASLQPSKEAGRRYPLAKITTGAFFVIAILFLTVLVLASYRLNRFQSLLSHITEDSIPEMTYSIDINNQINKLLYFSSRLTHVNSNAELRIVKQSIDDKVKQIRTHMLGKDNHIYQVTQLNVIRTELDNLYRLVSHKNSLQQQMMTEQGKLFTAHDEAFKLSQKISGNGTTYSPGSAWTLTYSEVITLANKALIKNRLQGVRLIFQQVDERFSVLKNALILLPKKHREEARTLTNQLQNLLLADNGLLMLKIKQLRNVSRVIGRDNFVKNLIDDFQRTIESRSYKIKESVTEDTHTIVMRTRNEEKIMIVTSILLFLFLFFIITFIQKRFVGRVITLDKNIMTRLNGGNIKLDDSGNDEISDMAKAFNIFADKIEEQKRSLHDLSLTDALTGLANRRALDQRLANDLLIAIRHTWNVAVILMDIDNFKKYNDHYGHVAGDHCLKKVAEALSHSKKRSMDFVARYGGEEFLFIALDTDRTGAQKIADNIIAEVNTLNIPHEKSDVASHVTLSIGIAFFNCQDKLDCEELLKNADHALYKAKLAGKNRSCQHSS